MSNKYLVIDPCHVISSEDWSEQWREQDMTIEKFNHWLEQTFDCVVYDNFGGDGYYDGVAVDSGCFTVMPMTDRLTEPTCDLYRTFDTREQAIEFADELVNKIRKEQL